MIVILKLFKNIYNSIIEYKKQREKKKKILYFLKTFSLFLSFGILVSGIKLAIFLKEYFNFTYYNVDYNFLPENRYNVIYLLIYVFFLFYLLSMYITIKIKNWTFKEYLLHLFVTFSSAISVPIFFNSNLLTFFINLIFLYFILIILYKIIFKISDLKKINLIITDFINSLDKKYDYLIDFVLIYVVLILLLPSFSFFSSKYNEFFAKQYTVINDEEILIYRDNNSILTRNVKIENDIIYIDLKTKVNYYNNEQYTIKTKKFKKVKLSK